MSILLILVNTCTKFYDKSEAAGGNKKLRHTKKKQSFPYLLFCPFTRIFRKENTSEMSFDLLSMNDVWKELADVKGDATNRLECIFSRYPRQQIWLEPLGYFSDFPIFTLLPYRLEIGYFFSMPRMETPDSRSAPFGDSFAAGRNGHLASGKNR